MDETLYPEGEPIKEEDRMGTDYPSGYQSYADYWLAVLSGIPADNCDDLASLWVDLGGEGGSA